MHLNPMRSNVGLPNSQMKRSGNLASPKLNIGEAKLHCPLGAALAVVGMTVASALPKSANSAEAIKFEGGCVPGAHITIAAVGDLLFNGDLQRFALSSGGSFSRFWQDIEPAIRHADLAYANLEGPVANITFDGQSVATPGDDWRSPVYRAQVQYSSFNYHPSLIADLKKSGFSIVSTANNHALDRGGKGVEQTILSLENNALAFSGTRKRQETNRPWSTVTRANEFNLAWIACTYGLNGHPDLRKQVLLCYEDRRIVLDEIRRRASDPLIDAVVLVPHWGVEFSVEPDEKQREFARQAVEAGVVLIVGAHPHMVQPWERLTGTNGRQALVIYSSGDFVSNELINSRRVGLISLIELRKRPGLGKAYVSAAGFVPIRMEADPVPHVVEAEPTFEVPQLPRGNRISLEHAFSLPSECP